MHLADGKLKFHFTVVLSTAAEDSTNSASESVDLSVAVWNTAGTVFMGVRPEVLKEHEDANTLAAFFGAMRLNRRFKIQIVLKKNVEDEMEAVATYAEIA